MSPSTTTIGAGAPSRASCWLVFLSLFGLALAYTCFSGHTWEDYFITYRASKNLATGHGLTFTVGERVHSFTSPLGVLLPALASLLTGNSSDVGALWIFRMMSMSAYAGAGVLLWRLGRGLYANLYPALFLVLLLATDAKTIDTATNGMESAFVVLFMLWNLWALLLAPKRRARHLGLAWSGLMWTRPDSFIYIGASAVAVLLFGRFEARWKDRGEFIRDCLFGGLITTAIYGPWLLWAWSYYGSPVPQTVIAKGVWMPPITAHNLRLWITHFPLDMFKGSSTLGTTFTPPYAMNTEWPAPIIRLSDGLSLVVMVVWLLPFFRWESRVTSFVFTIAHFYLTYLANFPAPWYLPIVTMLGFLTLGGVVGQLMQRWPRGELAAREGARSWRPHPVILAVTLLLPTGAFLLLAGTAWEMRIRQTVVEDGHRRLIGEWLKAHSSSPRDTVVLECLGYIGFYSNLKIYDYPGLSSPEVVKVLRNTKTRADYTHYLPEIASAYNPDWLVFRASELAEVNEVDRELLRDYYHLVKVFDCREKIDAIKFLPARNYHLFDSHFEVYHRNEELPDESGLRDQPYALRHRIALSTFTTNEAWNGKAYLNDGRIMAHAPSKLTARIPSGATSILGEFGFTAGAYKEHETKGASFTINAVSADGTRTQLYSRMLNPVKVEGDRGQHFFNAKITLPNAIVVEFVIEPPSGAGNAFGWTYWTNLRINVPESKRAERTDFNRGDNRKPAG